MVLLCWILTLQQNAACERWILRYVYILRRSSINIFLYISDESTTSKQSGTLDGEATIS